MAKIGESWFEEKWTYRTKSGKPGKRYRYERWRDVDQVSGRIIKRSKYLGKAEDEDE